MLMSSSAFDIFLILGAILVLYKIQQTSPSHTWLLNMFKCSQDFIYCFPIVFLNTPQGFLVPLPLKDLRV